MSFKNMSFRGKIIAMIVLIVSMTFLGAILTFVSNGWLQKRYKTMIAKNDYLEITTSNISDQIHSMGRQELIYLLRGSKEALVAREVAMTNLDLFVMELEGIEVEFLPKSAIESLVADINTYKTVSKSFLESITGEYTHNRDMMETMLTQSFELESKIERTLEKPSSKLKEAINGFQNKQIAFIQTQNFAELALIKADLDAILDILNSDKSVSKSSLKPIVHLVEENQKILAELSTAYEKRSKGEIEFGTIIAKIEKQMEDITGKVRTFNEKEIKDLESAELRLKFVSLGIIVVSLIFAVFASVFILKISRVLNQISDSVRRNSTETKSTSLFLQTASEKVSEAAEDQASSIQETVATLNEISAMVSKSVDSATISAQKAETSFRIANDGKQSVFQMRQAMDLIQDNIKAMTSQVESSNKQIEGIVDIINVIVQKTQVIHDIVFQTKLLSFNASVEAARAGENGKGFAVVAEEVGNLARMSGQAARDINELLSRSRESVEKIVKDSKSQIEVLVIRGGDSVRNGSELANRCESILGEVVKNVDDVKNLMSEIATAAKEESEGVHNITIAMNQIDNRTQENSELARETMDHSKQLANQADELASTVFQMDSLVRGLSGAKNIKVTEVDRDSTSRESPVVDMQSFKSNAKSTKASKAVAHERPEADDPGFEEVG